MIDATSFTDAESALATAVKAALPDVYVSNITPEEIPAKAVIFTHSGGGNRSSWGEASTNVGVNVYAETDDGSDGCRALVQDVQNALAVLSNDVVSHVSVPAGGAASVPRQTPPFQRYFAVTAHLRGQAIL